MKSNLTFGQDENNDNDILIPRRTMEERQQRRLQIIQRLLNKEHIEGDLGLSDTLITTLGTVLVSVGGRLDLSYTPITSLGNLQTVGGKLDLFGTPITNLGQVQTVGGHLYLSGTPITNLGQLQTVGGSLYLSSTPITDLGQVQTVGGDLDLRNTPIARMSEEERQRIVSGVKVGGEIVWR